MGYFPVDSRVVIYECIIFIRLATGHTACGQTNDLCAFVVTSDQCVPINPPKFDTVVHNCATLF